MLRGIVLLQPRDIASRRRLGVFDHLRNLDIAKLILRRRVLEQRTLHLVFVARILVVRKPPMKNTS
jgi:hypothetical protein